MKSSIQAQEKFQAKIEAQQKVEKEREEAQWRSRSSDLAQEILRNTNSALERSEENLRKTIEGFTRQQEDTLKTRFDIAESRQKVLSDNLVRETRLYGRLSAAGTPLTTMTIKLVVEHVPGEILNKVRKDIKAAQASTSAPDFVDAMEHHNVDREDARSFVQSKMDKTVIQPFVNWLGTGRFLQEQGILVLSLDKNFSALACVGWVKKPDIFTKEGENGLLPSGVLIGDAIEWDINRGEAERPEINLAVVGNSLVLSVELDQVSMDKGLLRYARNSGTTAALPDDVEFFSWSPSHNGELAEDEDSDALRLPFDSAGVHKSVRQVDSERNQEEISQIPMWMHHLRLQIIPNGVDQISKTYDLSLSSAGYPSEGVREDEPRGYVRIWHGHARYSKTTSHRSKTRN